jgi:hypothetical protein
MIIVESGSGPRSFLEAVRRIVTINGESDIATLLAPTNRVKTAMRAVEDARDDIFYETLWEFRRAFYKITFVEKQVWYEAPVGQHKAGQFLSLNDPNKKIPFVNYDDFIGRFPDLRSFPPGAGVGDMTTVLEFLAQEHAYGPPECYTAWGGYIGVMPAPDAEFIESYPSAITTMWSHATALQSEQDDIGLPRELWTAHHLLAMAYYKKALEYPDWSTDRDEAWRLLHKRAASKREQQDANVYHNTGGIDYNE